MTLPVAYFNAISVLIWLDLMHWQNYSYLFRSMENSVNCCVD